MPRIFLLQQELLQQQEELQLGSPDFGDKVAYTSHLSAGCNSSFFFDSAPPTHSFWPQPSSCKEVENEIINVETDSSYIKDDLILDNHDSDESSIDVIDTENDLSDNFDTVVNTFEINIHVENVQKEENEKGIIKFSF